MASVTIPNMPEELHRRLSLEAQRSGRSVDQLAILILNRALTEVPPVSLPVPIIPLNPVHEDEIMAAFSEGRE